MVAHSRCKMGKDLKVTRLGRLVSGIWRKRINSSGFRTQEPLTNGKPPSQQPHPRPCPIAYRQGSVAPSDHKCHSPKKALAISLEDERRQETDPD